MSLVLHNPQGVWWCRRVIRVFRVFGKEANAAFALPLLLPVKEMGDGPIRADPAAERIQRNCTCVMLPAVLTPSSSVHPIA